MSDSVEAAPRTQSGTRRNGLRAAFLAIGAGSRRSVPGQGSVGEVPDVICAQPITAALIVIARCYLFGHLGSLIPSRHSPRHRG